MIFDDAYKIALIVFVIKEFYSMFLGSQKKLNENISVLNGKIQKLEVRLQGLFSRLELMEKLDAFRK